MVIALLPLLAVLGALAGRAARGSRSAGRSASACRDGALVLLPLGDRGRAGRAGRCWSSALVRLLGVGLAAGYHPVHSRLGWQAWATLRVLDEARTWLFPLYASPLTPGVAAALGAQVGRDVEASTVLLIPQLTTVNDEAFLADDTLIGCYELGGGWLRVERVKIGKRAFVGNSGMAAPGRRVPKQSLVAVLSAAPRRSKAKAGHVLAGQPARPAAPGAAATATPAAPTTRRRGSGVARAARRALPARPGDGARRARASASSRRWRCSPTGRAWWPPRLLGGVLMLAGRGRSPPP